VVGLFALFVALCAIIALVARLDGTAPSVAGRAAAVLVAVTALFAAEALLLARRWAFPATAAMFLALFAAPVVSDGAQGWRDMISDPLGLVIVGGMTAYVLACVGYYSWRLFRGNRVTVAPRPFTRRKP
jgi:hypothetical protein